MSNDKQNQGQEQGRKSQSEDRGSDAERLRLENENLRLQNDNLRLQLQQTESMKAIAEAMRPKDALADLQKKEAELVSRLERERREEREALEAGARKFVVHLQHQLPVGTTIAKPQLLVGAENEHEAAQKYKQFMRIRKTVHEIAVVEVTADVEQAEAEVISAAARGYHADMLPG